MSVISYGCQTYPWKMNMPRYAGKLPHIARTAAEAGFRGLEAEICMLGPYFDRPEEAVEILEHNHLSLAALVLHQPWEHSRQTADEAALTDKAVAFLKHFPRAKLMVSHHAGSVARGTGSALETRRRNLIACLDAVSIQAADAGIITCYHPNSAENSLFRMHEDYDVLFTLLEATDIGYAPDIGHIVNGGMDAMDILKRSRHKIRHVHFKDRGADGQWAVMGKGAIDYPAIVKYLEDTGYGGWIMVEDESPSAAEDSDGVVMWDGAYMKRFMD